MTDTATTFSNPNKVAITPDGLRAYVTNSNYQYGGQTVSVIDTTTNTVINALTVGRGPTGVAITPDGNHAYIANMGDDNVSVIKIEQAPTLTGNPPPAVVGKPYDYAFTVTGHPTATVTVAPDSTPAGLTLSPAGILTGTPTTSGIFEFTITATNGIGDPVALPVTLEIADAPTSTGSLGNFGS
ncbi:YncE family protein [Rhodococcus sp. OK302]|uniref:YncE family protein n=1 Tax=Rhodococcus sp. OK302 TaxID=1882769 RepID=UPI001595CF17|nr:YncE family protein [Rhodococcus sp. OK302]